MTRRDEYAHLDDFDLALRSVEVAAEHACLEAAELRSHGYHLVQVQGLDRLLWGRDGRLHTKEAALTAIGIIPEAKEDS